VSFDLWCCTIQNSIVRVGKFFLLLVGKQFQSWRQNVVAVAVAVVVVVAMAMDDNSDASILYLEASILVVQVEQVQRGSKVLLLVLLTVFDHFQQHSCSIKVLSNLLHFHERSVIILANLV
jgi:anti-sigma-K factor RskA